jgi:hypothetical protein
MDKPRRRRADKVVTMPTVVTADAPAARLTRELVRRANEGYQIARRAYELYEARGREHGHDVDDWLQAERELKESQRSTAA